MHWNKRRLTQWHAGDFTIIDTQDGSDRPYRLESPDCVESYATLEDAKQVAALKNELALFKADNAQLRADLDQHRQAEAFERQANANKAPAA